MENKRKAPPLAMHRVASVRNGPQVPWGESSVHPSDFLSRLEQLEKVDPLWESGAVQPFAQPAKPMRSAPLAAKSMNDEAVLAQLNDLQKDIDRAMARQTHPRPPKPLDKEPIN